MARKDFSEAELKKGAKYYKYNSYDAATRKIKGRIGKQLERHEGKWTNPDAKFRSGDEAPWRDEVAKKIKEYSKTNNEYLFVSQSSGRRSDGTGKGITLEGFLDQNQSKKFADMDDNAIKDLSKITKVSETIIKTAQRKYNALTQKQKVKYISQRREKVLRMYWLKTKHGQQLKWIADNGRKYSNPELMINDFKKARFEDGTPFLTKNKNLKDAALFKHGAEQYCKIFLNFLQDQKFKIVSPTKENLFQFTPGFSEKNIFKMSIQQNNPNVKDKK